MKRGDLLFEIDPQPYRLAVDAAEAQLELAYQIELAGSRRCGGGTRAGGAAQRGASQRSVD